MNIEIEFYPDKAVTLRYLMVVLSCMQNSYVTKSFSKVPSKKETKKIGKQVP